MSTVHAESVEAVVNRLESEPLNIPRALLTMIDIVMIQSRTEINGKPTRRTSAVTEIVAMAPKTKQLLTNEVYKWNPKNDVFSHSSRSHVLEKNMKKMGLTEDEIQRELRQRKVVLEWMAKNNIRRYTDVATVIREYYADPARVYRKARVGAHWI